MASRQTETDRGFKEHEPGDTVIFEPTGWECQVQRQVSTDPFNDALRHSTYLLKYGDDVFHAVPEQVKRKEK